MAKDPVLFVTDDRTSEGTRQRLREAATLGITPRGKLSITLISHDDDCPALGETGACACIPDILITTHDGKRWLNQGLEWKPVPRKGAP